MLMISEKEFEHHIDSGDGYCPDCNALIVCGGLEPDSYGEECGICGGKHMMGMEHALDTGHIDIGDTEE